MRSVLILRVAPLIALHVACANEIEPGLDGPFDASSVFSSGGAVPDVVVAEEGGSVSSSGGSPGAGGYVEFGSGGEMSSGGSETRTCPPTQKNCGGICVPPSPAVGCGQADCTSCPEPPPGATAVCDGAQCGVECAEGYVRVRGTCVDGSAMGAGGAPFDPTAGAGGRGFDPGSGASGPGTGTCRFSGRRRCEECACSRCETQVQACTGSDSCKAVLECGVRNNCASTPCYCGDGLCLIPNGPCVEEIQTAAGTTNSLEIRDLQSDATSDVGRADAASLCMQENCATECRL